MTSHPFVADTEDQNTGQEMLALAAALFPICRSITGDGLRQTLQRLGDLIPLQLQEVPSGTQVFDWTVPNEWNIRDAWVKDSRGHKVIDFKASNLHVLNYSTPVHCRLSLEELRPHLYTLPDQPNLIPYRTSYYREAWGFCLSQHTLDALEPGDYEVWIDATLAPGHLTYGELLLPGTSEDEVLISCHCCHPSLANDNLSGMVLTTWLARAMLGRQHRLSYRFLFIPGTIGSITWLAKNAAAAARIRHGLVVACVGDPGPLHYKRSRRGNAEIDQAVEHVLQHSVNPYTILDFSPYGYDERQYCSPGFNLPVGSLTRTPHGRFPEYHTSADNLQLLSPQALLDSLHTYLRVFEVLEHNRIYGNTNPFCEPQLGRRGLYSALGGRKDTAGLELAMLWVLNLCDGTNSLLDVAKRAGLTFQTVSAAADLLYAHGLLTIQPSQGEEHE